MSVKVSVPTSVEDFLALAGGFLEIREAENNLIFGICSTLRTSPEIFAQPSLFRVISDGSGSVVAAALQTPPWNLVLSWMDDLEAVDALLPTLRDQPLPGVLGPTESTARFAARWTEATGQAARIDVAERIFRVERLIPPERPASGSWRTAAPADRELVARWMLAFNEEASPEAPPADDWLTIADRWIAGLQRRLYLWEDDGEVVSLAGAGGETPHGIRIGPVYTPPERRGRGYASSVTAAATADQLSRGRRFVFLFTDLANPTSNKIYRQIGYEPVCDVDMYRFSDSATVQG